MTTKEKIAIYSEAKKILINYYPFCIGICNSIDVSKTWISLNIRNEYGHRFAPSQLNESGYFDELLEYKPSNAGPGDYWWPLNDDGYKIRIKVIDEIIAKLKAL